MNSVRASRRRRTLVSDLDHFVEEDLRILHCFYLPVSNDLMRGLFSTFVVCTTLERECDVLLVTT